MKNVIRILGASNHSDMERVENDYYATHPIAIEKLIEDGGVIFNEPILEPCCGEGHLSKELIKYGYKVESRDLIDRGYGIGGVDFFQNNEVWNGDIVTNPPYNKAKDFVIHALDLIKNGNRVYMFLKLTFLESKSRKELFDRKELKTVYVFRSRVMCAANGDFIKIKGSAVAYAWYEFEKGYKGDPTIKWIN